MVEPIRRDVPDMDLEWSKRRRNPPVWEDMGRRMAVLSPIRMVPPGLLVLRPLNCAARAAGVRPRRRAWLSL